MEGNVEKHNNSGKAWENSHGGNYAEMERFNVTGN